MVIPTVLGVVATTWDPESRPYPKDQIEHKTPPTNITSTPEKTAKEPQSPEPQTSITSTQQSKDLEVAELKYSADALKKCASLLSEGIVCMFVPSTPDIHQHASNAPYNNDSVIRNHEKQRALRRAEYEASNSITAPDDYTFSAITPAAGFTNAAPDITNTSSPNAPGTFETSQDDTIAQAAMRGAYDLIRNRYTDALYAAQLSGDTPSIDAQTAVGLTQSALTSAAERAFEAFVRKNFGSRNFEGRDYDTMRSYFMSAFSHAAAQSVKTIGRRFVQDLTAEGGFKNLSLRSELIQGLEQDIASAFIDSGLAAAKNSQYAFLRNLEVKYRLREKTKPEFSVLTLQPLYCSKAKKHNLYAQAAITREGDRNTLSGGLGYRYMPASEEYVVGSNVFIDYEYPYNHLRASAGLDIQTSLLGASANYYKGLSRWTSATLGFEESPMNGYDLEISGRMPFLPALEVFGRGYRWLGIDGADDIDGTELRLEYTPVPAFTIEAGINDEEDAESAYEVALRYNYTFGAPAEYLYDWEEQFRQKSPAEYIFTKARRENTIRVQERVDAEFAAANAPVGPAILSTSPAVGATAISIGTDIALTFAADILAGTGNIVFTDLTDGSDDFTVPANDPRVSIVGNVATIDLSAQLLDFNSNYEITYDSGVFTDLTTAPSPALASGDVNFTTVIDPLAGFPAATTTLTAGSSASAFTPRSTTSTWQTTINVGTSPDGVIFESGATGRGIAATFGSGNLTFAAGQGNTTATGSGGIFGTFPLSSIPPGLHHFVFVAKPSASAEIGVYMDGIRIITEVTAAAMSSTEWAGTDNAGYGLVGSSIRAGVDNSPLTGATLTNNLSFYLSQQPASF